MVVLKGVPALLSPELLYALARMGHGDEIGERGGDRASGAPTLGRSRAGGPAQAVARPGDDDSRFQGRVVGALHGPPHPTSQ